ncbi:hypothetical protein B0H13DRAFT_2272954 [Mycena leptocephala]|nr:hypothetical protein B0H13DRAFT_2272954 [Mycena leptocephala]
MFTRTYNLKTRSRYYVSLPRSPPLEPLPSTLEGSNGNTCKELKPSAKNKGSKQRERLGIDLHPSLRRPAPPRGYTLCSEWGARLRLGRVHLPRHPSRVAARPECPTVPSFGEATNAASPIVLNFAGAGHASLLARVADRADRDVPEALSSSSASAFAGKDTFASVRGRIPGGGGDREEGKRHGHGQPRDADVFTKVYVYTYEGERGGETASPTIWTRARAAVAVAPRVTYTQRCAIVASARDFGRVRALAGSAPFFFLRACCRWGKEVVMCGRGSSLSSGVENSRAASTLLFDLHPNHVFSSTPMFCRGHASVARVPAAAGVHLPPSHTSRHDHTNNKEEREGQRRVEAARERGPWARGGDGGGGISRSVSISSSVVDRARTRTPHLWLARSRGAQPRARTKTRTPSGPEFGVDAACHGMFSARVAEMIFTRLAGLRRIVKRGRRRRMKDEGAKTTERAQIPRSASTPPGKAWVWGGIWEGRRQQQQHHQQYLGRAGARTGVISSFREEGESKREEDGRGPRDARGAVSEFVAREGELEHEGEGERKSTSGSSLRSKSAAASTSTPTSDPELESVEEVVHPHSDTYPFEYLGKYLHVYACEDGREGPTSAAGGRSAPHEWLE